jgi:tRNA-specific 2-thiouridylase
MFPLGELTKAEVRQIAAASGLKTADKQESFEICFVPDDNYRRFLNERMPDLESRIGAGDILRDGEKVGSHKGYPFFTVGQRGGIGAYGERMYVTGIDSQKNTISIGKDTALFRRRLIAHEVNLQAYDRLPHSLRVTAQVRYKDAESPATVTTMDDGRVEVVFDEPKRAITPGQSVVFYEGEKLIGGGVIDEVID